MTILPPLAIFEPPPVSDPAATSVSTPAPIDPTEAAQPSQFFLAFANAVGPSEVTPIEVPPPNGAEYTPDQTAKQPVLPEIRLAVVPPAPVSTTTADAIEPEVTEPDRTPRSGPIEEPAIPTPNGTVQPPERPNASGFEERLPAVVDSPAVARSDSPTRRPDDSTEVGERSYNQRPEVVSIAPRHREATSVEPIPVETSLPSNDQKPVAPTRSNPDPNPQPTQAADSAKTLGPERMPAVPTVPRSESRPTQRDDVPVPSQSERAVPVIPVPLPETETNAQRTPLPAIGKDEPSFVIERQARPKEDSQPKVDLDRPLPPHGRELLSPQPVHSEPRPPEFQHQSFSPAPKLESVSSSSEPAAAPTHQSPRETPIPHRPEDPLQVAVPPPVVSPSHHRSEPREKPLPAPRPVADIQEVTPPTQRTPLPIDRPKPVIDPPPSVQPAEDVVAKPVAQRPELDSIPVVEKPLTPQPIATSPDKPIEAPDDHAKPLPRVEATAKTAETRRVEAAPQTPRTVAVSRTEQIVDRIVEATQGPKSLPIRAKIHVGEIGPIRVEVAQTETGVSARLQVSSQSAQQVLSDQLPQLTSGLMRAGGLFDGVDIQVSVQTASSSNPGTPQSSTNGTGAGGFSGSDDRSTPQDRVPEFEEDLPQPKPTRFRRGSRMSRVDIQV